MTFSLPDVNFLSTWSTLLSIQSLIVYWKFAVKKNSFVLPTPSVVTDKKQCMTQAVGSSKPTKRLSQHSHLHTHTMRLLPNALKSPCNPPTRWAGLSLAWSRLFLASNRMWPGWYSWHCLLMHTADKTSDTFLELSAKLADLNVCAIQSFLKPY